MTPRMLGEAEHLVTAGERRPSGWRWAAALALCAAGCAEPAWKADQWASTRPELVGREIGRFGDVTPYVLASEGELVFFVCHWDLSAPLRVSLPPDANADERRILDKALRAWEQVIPGLRFDVADGTAQIRLRFRETGPEGARTAADCEVTAPFTGDLLRARIVSAQIDLRRAERDQWGKVVELAVNQLLGGVTHELGHALGLQGHAKGGKSVMVRETYTIEKIGEKLNDEKKPKPLQEQAMQALYSLSSGTVIERRRLAAGATAGVDAIARRAGAQRVTVRVGDRNAAVRWGPGPDLVYFIKEPAQLLEGDLSFEDALTLP
jgi:hypothetical protein